MVLKITISDDVDGCCAVESPGLCAAADARSSIGPNTIQLFEEKKSKAGQLYATHHSPFYNSENCKKKNSIPKSLII